MQNKANFHINCEIRILNNKIFTDYFKLYNNYSKMSSDRSKMIIRHFKMIISIFEMVFGLVIRKNDQFDVCFHV